jgi:Flp pilus assembly protein TadB
MLSSEDRRKLDTIERRLSQDDPALARALAAGPGAPRGRRRRLLVVAAVLTALVALLLLGPGALVVGVILLLVGVGFHARHDRDWPRTRWPGRRRG